MTGGHPSILTPEEIVAGWDRGLKAVKAIHHQAGNFLVDIKADEAAVFCHGTAWHYLPNKTNRNTRTFVGSCEIHLMRQYGEWKIDRFRFNLKFIEGNPDLEKS